MERTIIPCRKEKRMRRIVQGLLGALVLLCPAVVRAEAAERPRITVTGEALVQVRPDRVVVDATVETMDLEVGAAKQRNVEAVRKALAAARECGVTEKEVQTDHLSVDQRWDDYYKKQKLLGWAARTHLVLTLSDPSRLDELTGKLLAAGAVSVSGVDFQTTGLKAHRQTAREMALLAAREKAEKMAAVLGEKLGGVQQISEIPAGSSSWYHGGWWGSRSAGLSQNVSQNASPQGGGEGGEAIALGRIAIRASVSVTFELKR
jgi:uncharacterized protein